MLDLAQAIAEELIPKYDEIPRECPLCHKDAWPRELRASLDEARTQYVRLIAAKLAELIGEEETDA